MTDFIIIYASIAIVAIAAISWAFWKLQQPFTVDEMYNKVTEQVLIEMGEYIQKELRYEENDFVQLNIDVEGFDPVILTVSRNVYEKDNQWFIDFISATDENGKTWFPEALAERLDGYIN